MTRSESIASLATAFVAAQSQVEGALKDAENPHLRSKYADLASCWMACRKALTDNGLGVIQLPSADGPKVSVSTMLVHKSGEFIEETLTMTAVQNTCQGVGSVITYGRRYGLCAIVGISPEDDDGNGGAGTGSKEAARAVGEEKVRKMKKDRGEEPPPPPPLGPEPPHVPTATTAADADKFKALEAFADLKKEMRAQTGSDDLYYAALGRESYEKSNQIPRDKLRAVWKAVAKEFTDWKGTQPMPGEAA